MLAPAIMVTFIAADADGARFVEVRKPLRMVDVSCACLEQAGFVNGSIKQATTSKLGYACLGTCVFRLLTCLGFVIPPDVIPLFTLSDAVTCTLSPHAIFLHPNICSAA